MSDPVEPGQPPQPVPPPAWPYQHPIHLVNKDNGDRSRWTVFFRYILVIPHLIWLALWGIVVSFAILIQWIYTLITAYPSTGLHAFISKYLRYATHVHAYITLVANPFPGFSGAEGAYPVDLAIAPPERQNRWKTLFRGLLAIPAYIFAYVLNLVLNIVMFFGWFVALFTARMPLGLEEIGSYVVRFQAQTAGYMWFVTDHYPNFSTEQRAFAAPPARTT
jgi:hypothetical protein